MNKELKNIILNLLLNEEVEMDNLEFLKSIYDDLHSSPEEIALRQHTDNWHSNVGNTGNFHYNMEVWYVGDDEYALCPESDIGDSLYEYYEHFLNELGYEEALDEDSLEYYAYMNDSVREDLANSEADNFVENSSVEELLEYTGLDDKVDVLENRASELEEELEELKEELEELEECENCDEVFSEKTEEIEIKEDDLRSVRWEIDDIIDDEVREEALEKYYNYFYDELEDPIQFLIREMGWYSSISEMIDNGILDIDDEQIIDDWVSYGEYEVLSHCSGGYELEDGGDGQYWVIMEYC